MNSIRAGELQASGRAVLGILLLTVGLCSAWGQTASPAPSQPAAVPDARITPSESLAKEPAPGDSAREEATPPLLIGPGDELDVSVYGVPELTQHVRVENGGDISLPLIEKVHVAGLTSAQAQEVIERRLASGGFINDPHVSVYVKEYTTSGIMVQGQVNKPGIYPAFGRRKLSDVLLQAGGVTQVAGNKISITHGGKSTPDVITRSDDPLQSSNAEVVPGDTVTVSKAGIVYVLGEVTRPGGFVLQSSDENRSEGLSAVAAMALAFGPTRTASLNKARIIRKSPEGLRQINLPLKKIMDGKSPDTQLQAEDILYVPNSRAKAMADTLPGTVVSLLATSAIYRF
jgi:polysaccharide biosynthesis/export protein